MKLFTLCEPAYSAPTEAHASLEDLPFTVGAWSAILKNNIDVGAQLFLVSSDVPWILRSLTVEIS